MKNIKFYSPIEERINIASHAFGFVLGVVALIMLSTAENLNQTTINSASFAVFGISLMVLYAASTLYHAAKNERIRSRLRIFDHAAIYVLIAGTYTPFTLVAMDSQAGWNIFFITWAMAITGIVLKLFLTGRFELISTLMYVLMGWVIMFAIDDLVESLSSEGLFWLILGGVAYTLGAILYAINQIKYNHAIFHVFVLLGSFCHFISIRYYILDDVKKLL